MVKGTIGIPNEYFLKMASHDYNDYRVALAREFYQNSIDANATKIQVSGDKADRSITISDNGDGMNLDTLQNKLLVLGGSKKGAGAVGAFGKAKELLFFSWDRYQIKTQDLICEGAGASYSISEGNPYYEGTEVIIWVQSDGPWDILVRGFAKVGTKMDTDCKIQVDGQDVEHCPERGEFVKSLGWCDVYMNEAATSVYMPVRVAGIWMFDKYVALPKGTVTIEITKNSIEALTSNRDGLKVAYASELDKLIKKIVVDTKSGLEPDKVIIRERMRGNGRVRFSQNRIQEALAHVKDLREVVNALRDAMGTQGDAAITTAQLGSIVDAAGSVEDLGLFAFEDRIKFVGYKPDFIIKRMAGQQSTVDSYINTKQSRVLAKLWTEVVKQVLFDNGMFIEFTAGFTFDDRRQAEIEKSTSGEVFIFINPWKVLKNTGLENTIMKRRPLLVEDLKDKAIHEVAHIHYEYHDEGFVTCMHTLRARTLTSTDMYQKIAKVRYNS